MSRTRRLERVAHIRTDTSIRDAEWIGFDLGAAKRRRHVSTPLPTSHLSSSIFPLLRSCPGEVSCPTADGGASEGVGQRQPCRSVFTGFNERVQLVYRCLSEACICRSGFPEEVLLRPFEILFCSKGLIFETSTGNLVKLDERGCVCCAAHGTTFLTSDEIRATYGNDPWWGIQHLRRRERHPEFFVFLTYFDQPGALILARIVDWLDCGGQLPSRAGAEDESGAYAGLTSAMIDAFDHIFDNIKGFEEGQGGYFYNFLQHPARYVRLRQDVREWLERLRREGKRCFIATNSHSRYARTLLRHCLGPGWRSLFDLVVVNARKARFFYQVHPFFHLDASGRVEGEQASTLLGPPDLAGPDAPTPISVTPLLGSGPWSHQPTEEEEAVELIELFAQGNAAAVQALADTLRWSQRVRGERVRLEMDADGHVVAGAVMPPFRRSSEHTSAGEDEEEGGGAGGRRRTGSWQGSVITAGIMDATEEEDGASGGLSEVEAREAGAGLVTPSVPRPLSGRVFAARQHAQIAYVGDSLHGDVVAAQNAMGWMSVAVVEELESSFPSPVAREWTLHSQPDDGRDTTAEECALRWEEGPWGSFWSGGEEGRRSYFGDVMLKHSAYLVTDVAALSATV